MAKKGKRKPRVIARGKVLRISASVQTNYVNALLKHTDAMIADVRKQIEKLFAEDYAQLHFAAHGVGMDASIASQSRILVNAFKKRYDQLFGQIAPDEARKMTDGINRNSFQSVKDSMAAMPHLKDEGKKLTLSTKALDKPTLQILRNAANHSADFIKTIPERYLNGVGDAVYRSIATAGGGLDDLQKFLEKHDTGTKNWVKNTAMDQTRKAYNGLNLGRVNKLGVEKGEWIHSGGSQHPRELHEEADGEIFDLNKGLPVGDDGGDVMPGEESNCRCTFAPVFTEDGEQSTGNEENEDDEE